MANTARQKELVDDDDDGYGALKMNSIEVLLFGTFFLNQLFFSAKCQ